MEPLSLLFLLCLILLILLHTPTSKSDPLYFSCPANYTANSAFQSNLNHLLSSLPSYAAPSGFNNTTVGQSGADQVYGLALCRGDASSADCKTCLNTAAQDAVVKCPHGTSNTLWYDYCMLRYSNQSFFGILDNSIQFYMWNTQNFTDPPLLNFQLGQLMYILATKATNRSVWPPLFTIHEVDLTSLINIYGLAQCTRDLSPGDCYGCLTNYSSNIPQFFGTSIGGRIVGQNCIVRFESYPFYNMVSPGNEAAPPQPQSNGSTQTGGKSSGEIDGTTKTIIIVVISAVAAALLLPSAIYLCLRKKKETNKTS